jgi:DtxR family Mn-dependent transcriptional regulator
LDEVHDEAERLEHHISEALEARMAAVLGDPVLDPHGDPIPRLDGSVSTVLEQRLLDLTPGQTAIVGRVSDQDPERLRYLQRLGITLGTRVKLLETLPFDGPLRLEIAGVEQVIGRSLAATVQVAA